MAGFDTASCCKSRERRLAASAPGPSALPAAADNISAVDVSAAMFCWSVGCRDTSLGSIDFSIVSAAFRISARFCSWSAGTSRLSVFVCAVRGAEVRRDDLDRVGSGLRILSQFEKRRDRLDLWISQMQWIEIELEKQKQRRGEHDREDGRHDYRQPKPLDKPVHWSQRSKAHQMRLVRRVEHHQQRGQQRNRCKKGEDHPAPGDLTKLRQTAIGSWHEGSKTDRGCDRSQGQRQAGFSSGASEPSMQIAIVVPFGAVADAELEPEIDPETDEQDKERH